MPTPGASYATGSILPSEAARAVPPWLSLARIAGYIFPASFSAEMISIPRLRRYIRGKVSFNNLLLSFVAASDILWQSRREEQAPAPNP